MYSVYLSAAAAAFAAYWVYEVAARFRSDFREVRHGDDRVARWVIVGVWVLTLGALGGLGWAIARLLAWAWPVWRELAGRF